MPVAQCASPKCGKPFNRSKGSKIKFCCDQCEHDVDRARRRIRDVIKAEKTRLDQSARWWCEDCQAALSKVELAGHDECYVTLLAVDRRCRSCGKPIFTDTPNDPYCGQSCFLTFWSRVFPGGIEAITHHTDYAVLNDLTGTLPEREAAELFGSKDHGNQIVNLRKLHDQDQAAAGQLASPPVVFAP